MKPYRFYLYGVDGGLIGPASADLEDDAGARTLAEAVIDSYPGCNEIEIWEQQRYVGQSRKPYGPMPRDRSATIHPAPRLAARASAQRQH